MRDQKEMLVKSFQVMSTIVDLAKDHEANSPAQVILWQSAAVFAGGMCADILSAYMRRISDISKIKDAVIKSAQKQGRTLNSFKGIKEFLDEESRKSKEE